MTDPGHRKSTSPDLFENLSCLLDRRERLLEAVSTTAEWLLMRADWHLVVDRCLERLGDASGASRVFLHQNVKVGHGDHGSIRRFEWCAEGVPPLRDTPLAGDESYQESGLGRWAQTLSRGQSVRGLVEQLPAEERQAIITSGALEILVMPVFVGGRWWGYLGLDNLTSRPIFAEVENAATRAVARILGAAVGRRLAEEALTESEERYRQLVENARDLVYVHDLTGRFLSINQAGLDLTGYSREEVARMTVDDIVAPDFQDVAREQTLRKLAGSEGSTTYELEVLAKDGRRCALEVASTLVIQDNRPVAVQGIARDITERRRLEEQLRQAQKMEAVGRLAGGIAHDFNNILTVIIGYAENLAHQIPQEDPLREPALEISRAGTRAAELTRQLLAFSRRSPMQPRLVLMDMIVKDLERMLQRIIGEHIDLVTDLDAQAGFVKVDPAQLEQIILNLVLNARDAMASGGRLTLSTRCVQVEKRGPLPPPEGDWVCLSVEDNGCGMSHELQRQVFEPFFTTKDPGKGTGLGLSTAYGVVKQSGGHITVQSREGEGSHFDIFLPRLQRPVSGQHRTVLSAPRRSARGRILLVEDERSLRQLVADTLGQAGYDVVAARDGAEALGHFGQAEAPFNLLLSDVIMPGLSGTELAAAARIRNPELRVLYMSGYSERFLTRVDPKALTEHAFLAKPFQMDTLLSRVGEVLAATEIGHDRSRKDTC